MNLKDLLGKHIREIRKYKNMTQETLAELTNIEVTTLSNIERGKQYPNHDTIEKLARAFNLMPYELFMFEHLQYDNYKLPIDEMVQAMEGNPYLTNRLYKSYLVFKKISKHL